MSDPERYNEKKVWNFKTAGETDLTVRVSLHAMPEYLQQVEGLPHYRLIIQIAGLLNPCADTSGTGPIYGGEKSHNPALISARDYIAGMLELQLAESVERLGLNKSYSASNVLKLNQGFVGGVQNCTEFNDSNPKQRQEGHRDATLWQLQQVIKDLSKMMNHCTKNIEILIDTYRGKQPDPDDESQVLSYGITAASAIHHAYNSPKAGPLRTPPPNSRS